MLRRLWIGSLFIAGIQTPNCVRATVFDAMAYNYHVFLVRDAVAAKSMEIHQANIIDMQNIGIRIVDAKDVRALVR
jgi:nicotinamidase-related amidase